MLVLDGCGGGNTQSYVRTPGEPESGKTKVLETGANMLQSRPPISAIDVYMDGFHFYSGNRNAQMEAHHYCSTAGEDLIQCVIFDGNSKLSKLMGVEYIISSKAFATLGVDEKKLWHSHAHEVKSGQLIAPGIPKAAEHALMEKIVGTYGKTWHTWNTDQQQRNLPTGHPLLMMGFTADGQANPEMIADRDKRMQVSTENERLNRSDIQPPRLSAGADAWNQAEALQLSLGPLTKESIAAMGGAGRMQMAQPKPSR